MLIDLPAVFALRHVFGGWPDALSAVMFGSVHSDCWLVADLAVRNTFCFGEESDFCLMQA